jgi:hypothetical protein
LTAPFNRNFRNQEIDGEWRRPLRFECAAGGGDRRLCVIALDEPAAFVIGSRSSRSVRPGALVVGLTPMAEKTERRHGRDKPGYDESSF